MVSLLTRYIVHVSIRNVDRISEQLRRAEQKDLETTGTIVFVSGDEVRVVLRAEEAELCRVSLPHRVQCVRRLGMSGERAGCVAGPGRRPRSRSYPKRRPLPPLKISKA